MKHVISAMILGLFLFLAYGSGDDNAEKNSAVDLNSTKKSEAVKEQTPEELNEQLTREIEGFKKPFDNKAYDGSVEAIRMEIVLFGIWGNMITKAENSELADNVKLAKELRAKVSALQAKEFPLIRKRYGKIMANKMWEYDIDIKTTGKNNSVLELTGGTFAANRNIKEYQTTLSDMLQLLRFKQTRYRWYKGAREYTSYSLDVPADKELVTD
jgi:hypothetical protein